MCSSGWGYWSGCCERRRDLQNVKSRRKYGSKRQISVRAVVHICVLPCRLLIGIKERTFALDFKIGTSIDTFKLFCPKIIRMFWLNTCMACVVIVCDCLVKVAETKGS